MQRIRVYVRRASVIIISCVLLLVGQSATFPALVHADTTLDQIVADLGITNTAQMNLLGEDFGQASDQLNCEKDFLELVTSKKLTKDVFVSCHGQISPIVKILAPYIQQQQNITLPGLFLPFPLGPDPAAVIISGIYATDLGQSLLQLVDSAASVTACTTYVAALSETALLNPTIILALTNGSLSGQLYIGLALACGDVTSSILTLIAPIAIFFHPTVLGSATLTTPSLAPTAKQYCPGANLSSIACAPQNTPSSSTPPATTPPPAPTCSPATNQAALFTGKNFTGQCVVLNGGVYNDPASMNIPNDSVSSVKVGGSVQLELCRDNGLSNTCQWFSADKGDLSTTSVGALQASSAQVVDLSQYVTVCTSTQLRGVCKSFGPGTVPDLSVYGLSSNIVSIHVSSVVTLYLNDGVNLSGQPGIFNNDIMDLTPNGWNSRAKSLKIENRYDTSCNNDQAQNGILLYRNTNFDTGGCVLLTADNNDLGRTLNFANGTSLQFVGNYINHYQATIYVDANYGTACGTYTVNQSDLLGCAGKTASIKIQPYTPPALANNVAPYAARDHAGSDAVVDNSLSTEWVGGHATPIGFVFDQPEAIQDVVVFDRAQSSSDNNQINKTQLVFSDGTVINDIDMTSGGPRCAEVSFPTKTVTWVNVVPTDSSGNNGYKEVQIWDTAGSVSSQANCVKKYQYTPAPGNGPTPLMQNIVPQIAGGTYTMQQGHMNPVYVQATDPGNAISLSASNLPPSATFTDYGNGLGGITFTSDNPAIGSYLVTVQASNSTLSAATVVTVNVVAPKTSAVTDDWSSGTINAAKWNNWNGSYATVTNGKLKLTSSLSGGYYGVDSGVSGAVQDLTDSYATNELIDAGNQSLGSLEVYPLAISKAGATNNQILFYVSNNTVYARKQIAGVNTNILTAPYNPSLHKFFKIRESGGAIYFDTSSDAQTWTNFASMPTPFDVTRVVVEQMLGTWQAESSTTSATFDNFNISPVAPPATAFSDDWSSGAIAAKWNDWSSTHASVASSQLKLSSAAGGGYFGIDSGTGGKVYDLTDSSVQNLLIDAGNRSLSSWEVYPTSVFKDSDTGYALHFFVSGNTIYARSSTPSGFTNIKTATYNPLLQRYFRISESNGTIYWDTSADGYAWANFTSVPKPFDITAVRVGMMVGTWQAEAATTSATFDDFNVIRTIPPTASITDDWSSGSISGSKWNNWAGTHASVVSGQLQLTSTTGPNYFGVTSVNRYDLTNSSVTDKVINAGDQNLASFEVYPVNISKDSDNQLSWYISHNTIFAKKKIGGVQTILQSAAYNATNHKYFRIRESNGTIYWDYSSDGTSWTNFTTLTAAPFDLTSVSVEQMIGTWQTESSTTSAILDNFNLAP